VKIDVSYSERAFVLIDGEPVRYLAPGRHSVWVLFRHVRIERVSTANLLAELRRAAAEARACDRSLADRGRQGRRAIVYRKAGLRCG